MWHILLFITANTLYYTLFYPQKRPQLLRCCKMMWYIRSHLPKLFLPVALPPSSPSCHFPCHERGVLIIQPVSPCVCCDSCRWENSHRESDVEGFCSRLSCEALQWENTMWSCWTLRCRRDYSERPVSTSPFAFVVHAYFTSAVSKILNSYYCQKDV